MNSHSPADADEIFAERLVRTLGEETHTEDDLVVLGLFQ